MRKFILFILGFACCFSVEAQVNKKVILEFYTSSQCGNCPTGIGEIQRLLDLYGEDNIIPISHHAGWLPDPMGFTGIELIAQQMTGGAPTATIDRMKYTGESFPAIDVNDWEAKIVEQLAEPGVVAIDISGTYQPSIRQMELTVNTNFESVPNAGDLRINLMILENNVYDGVNYNQQNYNNNTAGHPFEGAGAPIVGYQHKNVTRAILDNHWGTAGVIPNSPAMGVDYTANYSYTIPTNFDETELIIVAFVSYYDTDVSQRVVLNGEKIVIGDLALTSNQLPDFIAAFQMGPNPSNDFLNLSFDLNQKEELTFQIIGVDGQVVYQEMESFSSGAQNKRLELETIPNGSYFLKVGTNDSDVSYPFVVLK